MKIGIWDRLAFLGSKWWSFLFESVDICSSQKLISAYKYVVWMFWDQNRTMLRSANALWLDTSKGTSVAHKIKITPTILTIVYVDGRYWKMYTDRLKTTNRRRRVRKINACQLFSGISVDVERRIWFDRVKGGESVHWTEFYPRSRFDTIQNTLSFVYGMKFDDTNQLMYSIRRPHSIVYESVNTESWKLIN